MLGGSSLKQILLLEHPLPNSSADCSPYPYQLAFIPSSVLPLPGSHVPAFACHTSTPFRSWGGVPPQRSAKAKGFSWLGACTCRYGRNRFPRVGDRCDRCRHTPGAASPQAGEKVEKGPRRSNIARAIKGIISCYRRWSSGPARSSQPHVSLSGSPVYPRLPGQ